MDFPALKARIEASGSGVVELDLAAIAADVLGPMRNLLKTTVLKLQTPKILALTVAQIRITGVFELKIGNVGVALGVEASFAPANDGIAYTFTLAPLANWLNVIPDEIKKVLNLLPVRPDTLWLTFSSVEILNARIDIAGREIADTVISKGQGYLFRFRSNILAQLSLDKAVFALRNSLQPLQLSTSVSVSMRLPPVLELTVQRLSFNDATSVTVHGTGKFRFFTIALAFEGDLAIGQNGFSFSIDVPQEFVAPFNQAFFRGIRLTHTRASFDGNFTAYTVGLSGNFKVAGSGNGGTYDVKYAAFGASTIPDLLELTADRLTLSDVFTVMAGVTVRMPPLLDRMVVLERSYLYYATKNGLITRSQVPSKVGAMGHSDISLLGYRGYAEVAALAGNEYRAKVMLSPIELGNLIKISGYGERTPASYAGSKVGRDSIALAIDTAAQTASGDIKVTLLDQAAVKCLATLSEHAIDFAVGLNLPKPMGQCNFNAKLRYQAISLKADFAFPVHVSARWGNAFALSADAAVSGAVFLEAEGPVAKGRVDVTAELGPVRVSFALSIDPRAIKDLPKKIEEEVVRQILKKLEDAAQWLKAVFEGAVEYVLEKPALLMMEVGETLKQSFSTTGKEAAKALKRAGYAAEQALHALQGQRLAFEDVMDTLSDAGAFTEREVMDCIRKLVPKREELLFYARDVAGLLVAAGGSVTQVMNEVYSAVNHNMEKAVEVLGTMHAASVDEVAKFVTQFHIAGQDAVKYIARAFKDLEKEVLREVLSVHYPAAQIGKAVEDVYRESERSLGRVRDEVARAWSRYAPEVTFGWKW